ncbi:LuxR family maltose regulon positive regulatory protein [Kribbella steppae]|uniref:LuxR family maltose regulon positive regulatory protein n=2 Tax=Kribbella steppae TaxID=2512223 RepID=A0A4R2HQR2_9ACTN|nr:LuxR family maltose regulon positive regulatory protein [Kribbella steppae]
MLDDGTRKPLTVVSAGAGWGKTLATASWAASTPAVGPVAWLSLDESDNHPRSFWSYLVAAIRSAVEVPRGNPLAGLAPGLGGEVDNLRRLVAGLTRLPKPVVIVLDDFQVIDEPAVLAGLSELLRRPPAPLRLVLLTRADPALGLHRLRIKDDLAEIRSRDLAFGVAEAVALLGADGVVVDPDGAQLLVERTEGWPAGLRLAAFFLKGEGPGRTPADFAGNDQAVTDYLAEEVLARQPPELRQFLLRTSVAERLSGGLAQVLTDDPRGQRFLELLERTNAFVVGLGSDRQWYRYHPLLREMLHHRLMVDEPQMLPDLQRRAAHWFAANGQPIEAMRHAAEAADWHLLGRLFVTQAAPLTVSTERAAVVALLARIPAELLADGAELAVSAAALRMHAGRFQDMQPHLERAQAQLDATSPESRIGTQIAIRLFSTAVARVRGDIAALVTASSEALDVLSGPGVALPAADQYRAIALSTLGTGLLWSGSLDEAEACLHEGLEIATATRLEASRINMLAHLGFAATVSGRLREGFAHAAKAVELVDARGWEPLTQAATAYLTLAMVHLQWNNVDEAQSLLAQGRAAATLDLAPRYALGLTQVRLDASLGRVEAARNQLVRLRHEIGQWQLPAFLERWQAITEAEVDLAAGDPSAAMTKVRTSADDQPPFAHEQTCLAEALLAGGDPHRAEEILSSLRHRTDDRSATVEAWLLTTLVADTLREDNRALEALGKALDAARQEGVRRPFLVVDTERLPRLLTRVQQMDPSASGFVDELLADMGLVRSHGTLVDAPAEPLTDRELSVVRYLPTMMTNAEIASELFVSVNTVKAHLKRIYQKLGVTSRRQAVHRARALGLLSG